MSSLEQLEVLIARAVELGQEGARLRTEAIDLMDKVNRGIEFLQSFSQSEAPLPEGYTGQIFMVAINISRALERCTTRLQQLATRLEVNCNERAIIVEQMAELERTVEPSSIEQNPAIMNLLEQLQELTISAATAVNQLQQPPSSNPTQ